MPVSPTLPLNVDATYADSSADPTAKVHQQHHDVIHSVINNAYLANIGATKTASFTLVQSNTGEIIPINVTSPIVVTVPSMVVGTTIELLQYGSSSFTLAASGISFVPGAGSPRAQGCSVALLWVTTTSVVVSGDLA